MFDGFIRETKPLAKRQLDNRVQRYPILTASDLLRQEKFASGLQTLEEQLRLPGPKQRYYDLCTKALLNFADYIQSLPVTQDGYFSHAGGALEQALDRCCLATQKCRVYLLASDEEDNILTERQALWMYVIFTAALFHRLGHIILKLTVDVYNDRRQSVEVWQALLGKMQGSHYSYTFSARNYGELNNEVTKMLAKTLLPTDGFAWIAQDKDVLKVWLDLLDENWEQVGSLSGMIPQAQAETILQYFEQLAQQHKPLLGTPTDKPLIDRAPTKFNTDKDNAGQKKTNAEKTRAYLNHNKENKAQQAAKLQQLGQEFLTWLQKGLANKTISMNRQKSPVQVIQAGVILAYPTLFNDFLAANPSYGNWQQVLQAVTQLGITATNAQGDTAFRVKIGEPNQQTIIRAVLIDNPHTIFPEGIPAYAKIPIAAINPQAASVIPASGKAKAASPSAAPKSQK